MSGRLSSCPHGRLHGARCSACDSDWLRRSTVPYLSARIKRLIDFYRAHPEHGKDGIEAIQTLRSELHIPDLTRRG